MSTFQDQEVKCPKCDEPKGVYELDCKTQEEWFACEACGWGYQTTAQRFGQNLLSELRDVISKARPLGWTAELDETLAIITDHCIENGWNVTDHCIENAWNFDDEDHDTLAKLRDILNRDFSERNLSDWDFVVDLSRNRALFSLKDGNGVFDRIEEPPKLM